MNNRLFIIEGLPCSGKSTTSAFVAELLKERGRVICVDEGSGDHPADYEFHAYVSDSSMSEFSTEEQFAIRVCSEPIADGIVVPLSRFAGELFDRLLKHKIYDFLPWDAEKPVMLEKWRSFVKNIDAETVYVFNCVLLQNPMCETMMRFGFDESISYEYIHQIAEIILPLKPTVIYLRNDDIAECVKKAAAEREGWLDDVIDYHVNGAYGRSISTEGFEGYISCLEERQRRELRMLSRLPVETIVLDNAHRDWNAAYKWLRMNIMK